MGSGTRVWSEDWATPNEQPNNQQTHTGNPYFTIPQR